ncbi:MAG TPA: hypothetical protein VMV46_22960 [Thermoanaerobaculia bacterium]|nr:hypothetical protein [Thermoanaerobaculia bacterium]
MLTLLKMALVSALALVSVLAVGAVATAGYVVSGGVASVAVDTPDVDLKIPVPLRLVDLGLGVARLAGVDQEIAEARAQLEPVRPILRDLAHEIGRIPEGKLVTVETETEWVSIEQRGGRFHVEVEAPDARVHVSVPRRAASRLLHQLASF